MFDRIIGFSIGNRLLVVLCAALLLAWGGFVVAHLPIDVFPDLNRPTVTLLTESGGLSPEEVEVLVTRPLEVAMNGAPGVERGRSQSAVGLSVVWVEFDWSTDIYRARQQVAERVSQVSEQLPAGVVPAMGPVSSIMGEIMLVGLVSPDGSVDGPALRTLADWTLRPRLLGIPGISQVIDIGGGVEQIQVVVDPGALAARGLTLDQVREAAAGAQRDSAGGFLQQKSQELLIRNLSRTADPAEIAQTVVGSVEGVPVALSEVATVEPGVGVMRGDAGVNGHPGVILAIQKQPGTSTIELSRQVSAALDELRPGLGAGVEIQPLFRQADFIEASITNVEEALRDGALLVTLVLVLFLLNGRTTLITLTAIPLSLVVAGLVLHAFGLSVNTMTLGGLAVAVGELVDDAIVDVENVFRRLKENHRSPAPRPVAEVVFEASREVRNSIVFATILVVLVFVPLFALSGIEGRLFSPLGVAYVTSILASLAVSLTVTPALCVLLLPAAVARVKAGAHLDGALVRGLKRLHRAALVRALRHPTALLASSGLLVLLAAATLPWMGRSFLPPFNEGTATINVLATPGTSLEESDHLGQLAERLLLSVPEVVSVGRRTGRAEMDEHAEGVHYSEIDVDFAHEGRDREVVLAEVRQRMALIPGVAVNLGQPISHRLDHLLSGVRAQIAIKLFGDDLSLLRSEAARLSGLLASVPGLVDLQVEGQVLIPQIRVEVDRAAALRFGIRPGALTDDLATALEGEVVGQVLDGLRARDLVIRFGDEARDGVEALRRVPLALEDGRVVTLGQLARIDRGTGPNQILHEDGRRRIVLSANTAGRDVGAVVADIEGVVAKAAPFPKGFFVTLGGQFESQREASRTIGLLSLFSLVGMFAVLYSHFRSVSLTLQVLLAIPGALIGSVAALWLTSATLSVATMVGFITLCGIVSRNVIMLISHYQHLVAHEGEVPGEAMVIRGALERLVPVCMTALSAGIALVPLALAGGQPGKEILTPVAQVILGGLLSSTLLSLVVSPVVFLRFSSSPSMELS